MSPAGWQHVSQSIMVEPEAARLISCILTVSYLKCGTVSFLILPVNLYVSKAINVMYTQFVFVIYPSHLDVWMRLTDYFLVRMLLPVYNLDMTQSNGSVCDNVRA